MQMIFAKSAISKAFSNLYSSLAPLTIRTSIIGHECLLVKIVYWNGSCIWIKKGVMVLQISLIFY